MEYKVIQPEWLTDAQALRLEHATLPGGPKASTADDHADDRDHATIKYLNNFLDHTPAD
ncbi:MAG: hypothetical protein KAG66_11500 [Methylococcales bacterium]|nr:hypothetical protein [Methylococcales bacterium]